jgi:hypothetical protein
MIDTRAVAQEVQDQLLAAINKGREQVRKGQEQVRIGQEQVRKGQEQLRKGQEQVRKGRDAVTGAIRTGNELAKSVRPSIPTLPGLRAASLSQLTDRAKLKASAQELADHVAAAQRNLTSKAVQVASPLVAEGVARLTKVVGTLQEARKFGQAGSAARDAATPPAAVTEAAVTEAAEAPAAETAVHADAAPAEPTATATDTTADAAQADGAAPDTAGHGPAAAEAKGKTRAAKAASAKNGTPEKDADAKARAAKPASKK